MKSRYPKSLIQKVIETHCRVMYENAPDNTNLDDFIGDHGDELLKALALRAEYNDIDEGEELDEAKFQEFNAILNKLFPLLFDAVMADLNFVREHQDDMVGDVLVQQEVTE